MAEGICSFGEYISSVNAGEEVNWRELFKLTEVTSDLLVESSNYMEDAMLNHDGTYDAVLTTMNNSVPRHETLIYLVEDIGRLAAHTLPDYVRDAEGDIVIHNNCATLTFAVMDEDTMHALQNLYAEYGMKELHEPVEPSYILTVGPRNEGLSYTHLEEVEAKLRGISPWALSLVRKGELVNLSRNANVQFSFAGMDEETLYRVSQTLKNEGLVAFGQHIS